jgi:hypothetical protein
MAEVMQVQNKVVGVQSAARSAGSIGRSLGLGKLKGLKKPKLPQALAAAAPAAAEVKGAGGPQAAAPTEAPAPGVAVSPAPGAPPAPPAPPGYKTWVWPSAEQERKSPWRKILIVLLVLLLLAAVAAVIWYTLIRDDGSKSAAKPKPATSAAVATTKTTTKPKQSSSAGGGVKAFVLDLEPLLKASAANRVKIVAAVRGVSNGCSLSPAQGASQAQAVGRSRSALLKRLNGLKAPNAQTAQVQASFRRALTASISANEHYAAWMSAIKGASPCPGSPTSNADFNAAESASKQATVAKQALTRQYNPLATQFGRTTFSPDKL